MALGQPFASEQLPRYQSPVVRPSEAAYVDRLMNLTVEIPDSLLVQTGVAQETLEKEGRLGLALHFFALGRLTSGQAAALGKMNRVDFLLEAGRHGIPVADLDEGELERELKALPGSE